MTAQPVPVRVTRYQCPPCGRTHSSRRRAVEHMGRCWHNPEARGCKTCKHFESAAEQCCGAPDLNQCYTPFCADAADQCRAGVSLAGRPACPGCGGYGWADINTGAQKPCGPHLTPVHIGDGREVKPGPIVGCEKWETRL